MHPGEHRVRRSDAYRRIRVPEQDIIKRDASYGGSRERQTAPVPGLLWIPDFAERERRKYGKY